MISVLEYPHKNYTKVKYIYVFFVKREQNIIWPNLFGCRANMQVNVYFNHPVVMISLPVVRTVLEYYVNFILVNTTAWFLGVRNVWQNDHPTT